MGHHYEMPIASFLAVILVLLPLPWHWKARNVATLSMIAWLATQNLLRGISAIIWMDNVVIHAEPFCDITTKVTIGITAALPACSLCITRNLEHIAATRVAIMTAADKRRRRNVDLCITILPPILIMILHYVVQGHRFDIFEDIGCVPATYWSLAALFIVFIPPTLMSLASLSYAALALRHFIRRRAEFERHLRDSQSVLNTSRYMRLMALAVTEMVWGTSLGIYVSIFNFTRNGFRPYTSWGDVHYNFSRIAIWRNFLISKQELSQSLLIWWITPTTAILFFLFFGFSEEALEGYASMIRWVRRIVFRQKTPTTPHGTYSKGTASQPGFMPVGGPRKLTSAFDPDDICLELPDLSQGAGTTAAPPYCNCPNVDKADEETASTLTLPDPDFAGFVSEPVFESLSARDDEAKPSVSAALGDRPETRCSLHSR